jgi:hypothetical protein
MVIWWVEGRMALAREPLAAAAGGSGNRVVERRQFLTGSLAILVVTLGAEAQPHDKHLCRVGFLGSGTPSLPLFRAQHAELMMGLQEFAFIEGQSVLVESCFAEGDARRIPSLARELVARHVDVLLAIGPYVLRALHGETKTLPIVALDFETDPVEAGFAQSLADRAGISRAYLWIRPSSAESGWSWLARGFLASRGWR